MPIYRAYFFTEADWAKIMIEAATPELALQQARRIESEETETLDFQSYDGGSGVKYIEICSADQVTVAEWQSDDRCIRLAAQDLFAALQTQTEAAQAVIDAWSEGDLAGAVRMLDASLADAQAVIAKAKGGAS